MMTDAEREAKQLWNRLNYPHSKPIECIKETIQQAEQRGKESVRWTALNSPVEISEGEIKSNELSYQNGYRKGLLRGAEIAEKIEYDFKIRLSNVLKPEEVERLRKTKNKIAEAIRKKADEG